ncbi:MAG: DMT family transporter [Oscillospiraceae bacterium]|nr:DMT family transporter [Oscillospiraceae bacterium]
MKNGEMKGNILLVITAVIWGAAFVAQSVSMDHIGAFTFQGVRSLIGSAVLVPVILALTSVKKKKGEYVKPGKKEKAQLWKAGIICGIILTVAANLQQAGIQYTTAGKAGFITALYIVVVPVLGLFMKKKVSLRIWMCVIMAMVGLYLLSMTDGFRLSLGDTLVLLCAIAFSFHIVVVDHYASIVDGVKLSCIQFLVCGVISSILMFIFEEPQIDGLMKAAVPILYAGVLSCGVAYTLQIVGQKYTRPTVASLLMSLESVFAVLAGMIILREIPTAREAIGCIVMFAAIIITQLPEKTKIKN